MPLIGAPLIVLVRRRGRLRLVVAGRELDRAGDRGRAVAARGRRRHDLLCDRQLAAAVGHRVPRRRGSTPSCSCSCRVVGVGRRCPTRRAASRPRSRREQHYLFYAMFCLCLAGLLGITITGDAFNLFVFLEISSLSTYVLIALGPRPAGAGGRVPVPVMGTIGATFYRDRHRAALPDDRHAQPGRHGRAPARACRTTRPVLAALAFITVGIGAEARAVSAAPVAAERLHLRAVGGHGVPRRHGHQGRRCTCCCASTSRCSARRRCSSDCRCSEVLLRSRSPACSSPRSSRIFQGDLKRLFAYSSVAQIGYIIARARAWATRPA